MRLLLALTVLLALMVTAPAGARERGHRMTFEYAQAVAVDYWTDQGVTVPCRPTLSFMTEAEAAHADDVYGGEVDMLTDPTACSIDISPTADYYRTDRDLGWMYCEDVVHEYGHLTGLADDEAGGIMDLAENVVPFGCAHPRQWMVLQGWREPPRWVRRSPVNVRRLWLAGHGFMAQTARQRWLHH